MNAKKLFSIVLLVALAFLPLPVSAQDGCSNEEIAATLAEAADLLTQAQELSGVDALDALIDVKTTLAAVEHCRGLDFEGDRGTVFDPIIIPSGIYRVTGASTHSDEFESTIIYGTVLSGTCDDLYIAGSTLSLMIIPNEGIQTTFASEDCEIMWESSFMFGNPAPFTVTFEKIQ